MKQIKIGTILDETKAPDLIPKLVKHGFECFEISIWERAADFTEQFKKIKAVADECGAEISTIGVYGNPMIPAGDDTLDTIKRAIDNARLLGTNMFSAFTGRVVDRPVEESYPVFEKMWPDLLKRCEANGLRLVFENCDMGGNWQRGGWNIAFNPIVWEVLFNILNSDNAGLEWEPCHQMGQLIDPLPQLRKWVKKVFHVHGKDATIAWDVVKTEGLKGPHDWMWHRCPGFGDTNWTDLITILRHGGYEGNIDIEGFHDPDYKNELEWSAQVTSMNYLKRCRGGDIITL